MGQEPRSAEGSRVANAGELRAQLKGRYAGFDYAVAAYNQTLITALSDVAMQLAQIRSSDAQLTDAQAGQHAAQDADQLPITQYRAGLTNQLPVRIRLDQRELEAHPLRIGLSMMVDVATRDDSGTQLGATTNTSYRTDVFTQYCAQADAEIAKVIAQNETRSRANEAQPARASGARNVAQAQSGRTQVF